MTRQQSLSVSEAMGLAKRALEGVQLRVVGEVSELSDKPGYKGVYFTIGDGSAVMPCMMWRDAYTASGVRLRCGMLVEVGGTFTVYAPKGRMQFTVRSLAAGGEGDLRLQVAALAKRLEAEGLMRPERKRSLPAFPERIGLVTSPRGKAVHDVLRTLRRRYPAAEVVFAGVTVEGADAVAAIAHGLRTVERAGVDVVLLVRGGGSYEDLMPFNAEETARAIASLSMPVVTGIGHEPDTTIADMVADVRASTPTAAAEASSPDGLAVSARIDDVARLLGRALAHNVQAARHRLAVLAHRPVLQRPVVMCETRAQTLDLLQDALARALPAATAREAARLDMAAHRLGGVGDRMLQRAEEQTTLYAARLRDLSPLNILGRGYAVCFDGSGRRIVRDAAAVGMGERVKVKLGRGSLDCVVEGMHTETEER